MNLLYFALVLAMTMGVSHPVSQICSLLSAFAWLIRLEGRRAAMKRLVWLVPMALMAAAVNPAFSHKGVTVLAYLPSGNPLTLESILYGLSAGALVAGTVLWFACCARVLTTDKFLYLFGRALPALSLLLSMTLRAVPRFSRQLRQVSDGQRALGRDPGRGNLLLRARRGTALLSILTTWALENAVDTADSMKSRGYGLPGRTAFSPFRLDRRDRQALVWLGGCGFFLLSGWAAGGFDWRYYPSVAGGPVNALTGSLFLGQLALFLAPTALDRKEERAWRSVNSMSSGR